LGSQVSKLKLDYNQLTFIVNKLLALVILISLVFSCQSDADNSSKVSQTSTKPHLVGLTLAPSKIISEQNVSLDGVSIPIYDHKGKKVEQMEMLQLMVTGKYAIEHYMDSNSEIKLISLREGTEEEIKSNENRLVPNKLVGNKAWPFEVKDLEAKTYSLEKLKGKVIVMNHWFVECKPCIMEMPELNRLAKKYENQEIVFIGVSRNSKKKLESFLETNRFNFSIIPDAKHVSETYQVSNFPTNVVIDKEGKIAYYNTGLNSQTIRHMDETIQSILN